MSEPVAVLDKVKSDKREKATKPKRATREIFMNKRPHTDTGKFKINGEEVECEFQAVGRKEYDLMITSCPPTTAGKARNESYDQATFAPKLLARVMIDPELSEVDWRNIWADDAWNRAELGDLFFKAVDVCSYNMVVSPDPTEAD